MVNFIAGLLIGLLIGGVGALFIRKNNAKDIDPLVDKADEIIDNKLKKK